MTTTPEVINLNTPEGKAWGLDYVHEKMYMIPFIVEACRKAACSGDMSALHAELSAIDDVATECAEFMNIIID